MIFSKLITRKFYKTNPHKSDMSTLLGRYCDIINHKLQPN